MKVGDADPNATWATGARTGAGTTNFGSGQTLQGSNLRRDRIPRNDLPVDAAKAEVDGRCEAP
jgi:hypothetical protein